MGCVISTGGHKLPLMVIGLSKHPRCFRNINLPKMHYRSSKNAWQNRDLFKEWFHKIFVPEVQDYLSQKKITNESCFIIEQCQCTWLRGRIKVSFY